MPRKGKAATTKEPRPKPIPVGPLRVEVVRKPKDAPPGVWYWRAVRYTGGKAEYPWVGTGTRAQAVAAVAELVALGDVERTQKEREAGAIETVEELLEYHVGHLEQMVALGQLAECTLTSRRNAGKRLLPGLGSVKVALLTDPLQQSFVVTGYARRRLEAGHAPSTIHLDLRELRAALRWGHELGLVPSVRLRMPPLNLADRRRSDYTPIAEEVVKILGYLPEGHWSRLAVHLVAGLGGRLGELAQLRWRDVELWLEGEEVQGCVTLHGQGRIGRQVRRGKTGARVVPLPPDLAQVLHERAAEGVDPDASIYGVQPSTVVASLGPRWLAQACEAAGLPRWSPGGGRRLVSEALLEDPEVDLVAYKSFTGHDPTTALRNYARGRSKRLQRLATTLKLPSPDPHKPARTGEEGEKEKPRGS